jgi:hypothetical protein
MQSAAGAIHLMATSIEYSGSLDEVMSPRFVRARRFAWALQ